MLDEDASEERLVRREGRPIIICMFQPRARQVNLWNSPPNSTASKISDRVTNTESKASSATWLETTSNLDRNCTGQ
jgi:ribosomal protein L36